VGRPPTDDDDAPQPATNDSADDPRRRRRDAPGDDDDHDHDDGGAVGDLLAPLDEAEGELIDEEDRAELRRAERIAPSEREVRFLAPGSEPGAGQRLTKVVSVHGDHLRAADQGDAAGADAMGKIYLVHLARRLLIQRRDFGHPVAVGDDVHIEPLPTEGEGAEPQARLAAIVERRNAVTRPAPKVAGGRKRRRVKFRDTKPEQVLVANLDQVAVVYALEPGIPPRTNLIDRFLVAAERNTAVGLVVLNKLDLVTDRGPIDDAVAMYERIGVPIVACSAVSGEGIDALRDRFRGRTTALAGPSGVGKSSLLNALQPGLKLRVGATNRKTGKGRHTTTTSRLLPLTTGGFVVDTPGIREFGLQDLALGDAYKYFVEIESAAADCEFSDCSHTGTEPGCGVIAAVEAGTIDARRYESFLALRATLEE
jgi:ribosome biogenesis GTPase